MTSFASILFCALMAGAALARVLAYDAARRARADQYRVEKALSDLRTAAGELIDAAWDAGAGGVVTLGRSDWRAFKAAVNPALTPSRIARLACAGDN